MLTFVLLSNLLISVINLFLIIRFHRLRKSLAKLADNFNIIEAQCHNTLYLTPLVLNKYKERIDSFKQGYQRLAWQWKKIKQIVALFRLFYRIYARQIESRS